MTQLRHKLLEELQRWNYSTKTMRLYVTAVKQFRAVVTEKQDPGASVSKESTR